MSREEIIKWLLDGDVSVQYQAQRDLRAEDNKDLQNLIATVGWGARLLSQRNSNGHWGERFYQPKWISTHYTLLDLRNLCLPKSNPVATDSIRNILLSEKGPDGGILPIGEIQASDVCVNGMFLNYASYFQSVEEDLQSVVDFLLQETMDDGGFNCRSNRSGAVHSSVHSTISVLEGITEFQFNGFTYRRDELELAKISSIEFLLKHHLYLSDRTGEIINKSFLRLPYPSRWYYDILRALDYFQYANIPFDTRMRSAIEILKGKQNKNGYWNLNAQHPGKVHFEMEKAGKPSRWNTLRAMRVLEHYGNHI